MTGIGAPRSEQVLPGDGRSELPVVARGRNGDVLEEDPDRSAAEGLLEREGDARKRPPVLPQRDRRIFLRPAEDVLPLNHPPPLARHPEPVDVFGRESDAVEREADHVAEDAVRTRFFARVLAYDAGIEDLPRREQPVRIVDEPAVRRLEELLLFLPLDGAAVHERRPLPRVDVEVDGIRRAGLVRPEQAVVAGVAVPEVPELRRALALALGDEVEPKLPGFLPGGLPAERVNELPRDLVRAFVGEKGRRRGERRERDEPRREQRNDRGRARSHGRIIFPARAPGRNRLAIN